MHQPGMDDAGRSSCDTTPLIKPLVLQQVSGLSDPDFGREAYDQLTFRHFPEYTPSIPDHFRHGRSVSAQCALERAALFKVS